MGVDQDPAHLPVLEEHRTLEQEIAWLVLLNFKSVIRLKDDLPLTQRINHALTVRPSCVRPSL